MPANPTARNPLAKSPMPAIATSRPPRRDMAMRRVRRDSSRRPSAGDRRRASTGRTVRRVAATASVRSNREDRGGEKRPYTPRGDRPNFNRDDRPPRRDRDDARPAARFRDRKFGDKKPYTPRERDGEKRPYTPRGEGFRKDGDRPRGDRPYSPRPSRDGDRPERKFGGDKKFSWRRGRSPTVAPARTLATGRSAAIPSRGRSARIAAKREFPSAPRRRAKFRQAALRPAPRRSPRRRPSVP